MTVTMMLLGVAALALAIAATMHARRAAGRAPLVPVVDARAERELRSRYLTGQISIDVYLDGKYGTAFSSAGNRRRAG